MFSQKSLSRPILLDTYLARPTLGIYQMVLVGSHQGELVL